MALRIAFAQDLSGSFSDDITIVRTLISDIVSGIKEIEPSAEIAVSSFVDKPQDPFGASDDYVYRTDLGLTSNQELIQTTYDNFIIKSGNDGKEAQLEALLQLSQRSLEIGWTDDDQKVIILFTDASYHKEGDNPGSKNNYDAILDGTPAGTGEDYPSVEDLGFVLRQKNITPIFAVTSEEVEAYETLVTELGAGGGVVTITSNSDNIVDAVKAAVVKSSGIEYLSPLSGISFQEGESYNIKVRLQNKPKANVELQARITDIDPEEAALLNPIMTFTPENWDVYQDFTISSPNDSKVELNKKYAVSFDPFISSDTAFSGYTPASIPFTLIDDDLTPIEDGESFTAPKDTAISVSLGEDSIVTPSEKSDTVEFSESGKSTVKGTSKELRDDIFYGFGSSSELEIEIDSALLVSTPSDDLAKYFLITEGSAVIQVDTNLDGDFDDVTDTIFTFKGSYDVSKFNYVKSDDGIKVSYASDDVITPAPSPSPLPSPSPSPEPSPTPESIQTDDGFTQFTDADDTLLGQSNIKYRMMGGDDFLEVIGGSNYANGNMGEDNIVLRGGFGEYLGGKDSDTFEVFAAEEGTSINGNRGEDIITGSVSGVTYRGGKDNDTLAVSQGEVWGDLGTDVFRGVAGEGYAVIQDYNIGEDVVELTMDGVWSNIDSGLMFTDTSGDKLMLLMGINDVEQVTVV